VGKTRTEKKSIPGPWVGTPDPFGGEIQSVGTGGSQKEKNRISFPFAPIASLQEGRHMSYMGRGGKYLESFKVHIR